MWAKVQMHRQSAQEAVNRLLRPFAKLPNEFRSRTARAKAHTAWVPREPR
jgi:hypothetical protein